MTNETSPKLHKVNAIIAQLQMERASLQASLDEIDLTIEALQERRNFIIGCMGEDELIDYAEDNVTPSEEDDYYGIAESPTTQALKELRETSGFTYEKVPTE